MEKGNEVAAGGPQVMQAGGGSGAAVSGSGGRPADQTKEREPRDRKIPLPDGSSARINEDGRFEYSDADGNPIPEPDQYADENTAEQQRAMSEWLDARGAKLDEWVDFGERSAQLGPDAATLGRKLAENSRFAADQARSVASELEQMNGDGPGRDTRPAP